MAVPLTVCVLTFNSERLLRQCIAPLLEVADELIAVDSGSTDATLAILREFGIEPVHRDYRTHADQMNYAVGLARHEWVLCMDSDEITDAETLRHIRALKETGLADPGRAYRIRRFWRVLDRPVHAIYPVSSPDFPVRLFNRQRARFNDAPVDDKVEGHDATEILPGRVEHDTFYSVHEVFHKLNVYTTRVTRYRRFAPSLGRALFSAVSAFFKWYLVKGGWKDGRVGVVAGVYASLYSFLKYFKPWFAAGK